MVPGFPGYSDSDSGAWCTGLHKRIPSRLASCLLETRREPEEKKVKILSQHPFLLSGKSLSIASLILWKMLNDRNGTSYGETEGYSYGIQEQ